MDLILFTRSFPQSLPELPAPQSRAAASRGRVWAGAGRVWGDFRGTRTLPQKIIIGKASVVTKHK